MKKENLPDRPPVVAVLGHVNHGKTTLLSKIKKRDLTGKEQGGITQHIGAYQIKQKTEKGKEKTITFIDTPGHVAFAKMRARGAQVTDLVVLVIAADDGVMPQTKESLEHIRAAQVPFLVAINKIDLAEADPQGVKEQLAKQGVVVEELGGKIVCLEVSAKTGQGLDHLLEMILLMGEMEELQADPQGPFLGVVIESRLDKRRGPMATVLVREGTLKLGQKLVAEDSEGKVKALFDERGKRVKQALPSQPVEVLGFEEVPPVGGVVKSEGKPAVTEKRETRKEVAKTLEGKEKKLKIILKSDVQGTLEAILANLPPGTEVVNQGVGEVTESDVLLAETTQALIVAFRVQTPASVKKLAQIEGVTIDSYEVIYKLLEALEEALEKKKPEEKILGRAEIIAEFKIGGERIAGGRVQEGRIKRQDQLTLVRDKKVVGQAKIASLKHKKEDIEEAEEKMEFGVILTPSLDFKIGDFLICKKKA